MDYLKLLIFIDNQLNFDLKVYGLAELSLKSMISYYVDSCSSNTSMDIAIELSNELCKRTGTYTPLSCPYDVRLDCQKDLDYQDLPVKHLLLLAVIFLKMDLRFSDVM